MKRLPRGYVGTDHVTIGSDILAVLKATHLPELALGEALAARVRAVKVDEWYPIDMLLDIFERLDQHLGQRGLLAMGWSIFQSSHAVAVRASGVSSARELLFGLNGLYRRANQGDQIGEWKVLRFEPGLAELEKTTPHHCVVEEGIVQEALRTVGVPAKITQTSCFRSGAASCIYVVQSAVVDERWGGAPPPATSATTGGHGVVVPRKKTGPG